MSTPFRAAVVGIFLFALFFSLSLAHAEEWKTYVGGRFGYSVQYPASFKLRKEAENGSGMEIYSEEKKFSINVSGHFIHDDFYVPLDKEWAEILEEYGSRIFYKEKTPYSYAFAGLNKDGTAFYSETCYQHKNWAHLYIQYPAADRKKYAAWVKRIADSFIPFLHGDYDRVTESFEGEWSAPSLSNPKEPIVLTLLPDGKATEQVGNHHGTGTWKMEDDIARIRWANGWVSLLRHAQKGGYELLTWKTKKSPTANPDDIQPARRVQ